MGILYLVILIKDTRGGTISNENDFIEQDESMNNCLGAFSISNVIKVFKTCFKKRSGYIRGIILLLILTMLFNMGTDSSNLIYLFTRLKLDWDEQYYAVFAAVASGATSLFTFAFITISSYGLNVHDTVIGITGALFGLLGRLTYAFASKTWMMYLGKKNNMVFIKNFKFSCLEKHWSTIFFCKMWNVFSGAAIGLLSSTPSITIRSALSKVTPSNEIGAIFSLLASLEAATPLVLAPLYTFVYNQTLDVFPGAIMVLQAGIYFLAIITFVIIYVLFKKSFNNDEENILIIENEENVAVDDTEDWISKISFMYDWLKYAKKKRILSEFSHFSLCTIWYVILWDNISIKIQILKLEGIRVIFFWNTSTVILLEWNNFIVNIQRQKSIYLAEVPSSTYF